MTIEDYETFLFVFTNTTHVLIVGWNSRFNNHVGRRHPNLWVFIKKLKQEQTRVEIAIGQADTGVDPPRRRRKWRRLEARIARLTDEYNQGQRNVQQLWNAMTHVVMHFH